MTPPFIAAVALGDEIQRFGSYFGYAAIIGLGVLSLLYFAQAREVKRLREWAGRAPERDAEVAQRVQSDAQRRVGAQPNAAASSAVVPASPQTAAAQHADAARKAAAAAVLEKFQQPGVATPPAASPGVGPPGSLARALPAPGSPGAVPVPASPGATQPPPGGAPAPGQPPAGVPAGQQAQAPAAGGWMLGTSLPGSGGATPSPPGSGGPTPSASPPGSGAATPGAAGAGSGAATPAAAGPSPGAGMSGGAASGAAGASTPAGMPAATAGAVAAARQATAPSRSTGPAYANGGGQETHESDAARPAPLPDLPPRPPRNPANATSGGGGSRSRVGVIVGGVSAALVIAVVLVIVLTSGGDKPSTAGNEIGDVSPPAAVTPQPAPASAKVDRAKTKIAVLNGTTTTGLARGVADKLEKGGFTIRSVGDNADQALATTTISYFTGSERAARTVAELMDVSTAAVKPVDTNTQVAVAPDVKVVVVVGNDRSTTG